MTLHSPLTPSPVISVGVDLSRRWVQKYPLGEVAALLAREKIRWWANTQLGIPAPAGVRVNSDVPRAYNNTR